MQIMNLLLKNSAYVSHMMFRAGEPFSISSINLIMEAFQLSEMKVEEIVFTYGIECARPEKQRQACQSVPVRRLFLWEKTEKK